MHVSVSAVVYMIAVIFMSNQLTVAECLQNAFVMSFDHIVLLQGMRGSLFQSCCLLFILEIKHRMFVCPFKSEYCKLKIYAHLFPSLVG